MPDPRSPVPPTPLSKPPHFTIDLHPLAHGPSAAFAPANFASLIVTDFPALFSEFRGMHFKLLWRGSHNGFGAGNFHGAFDGRAPTLALI
jgi:hypothetical protein